MADPARRSWLQFSLRTFFWLILVVAIGIVAYRRGYDTGFADHALQRANVGEVYFKVYYVGDIRPQIASAVSPSEFDNLINEMTTNVLPNTWDARGGQATVSPFAPTASIVVGHDQDGHERVSAYLDRHRSDTTSGQQLTAK